MNEIGTDMPIMMAGITPKVAMHMISTSTTAVATAASREEKSCFVLVAWSSRKEACNPCGQSLGELGRDLAHLVGKVDGIGAKLLGDTQRDGGGTVDARIFGRIGEGAV